MDVSWYVRKLGAYWPQLTFHQEDWCEYGIHVPDYEEDSHQSWACLLRPVSAERYDRLKRL